MNKAEREHKRLLEELRGTGIVKNVVTDLGELKTVKEKPKVKSKSAKSPGKATVDLEYVQARRPLYFCCEYCDRVMVRSNVYMWQEDKSGKPYDVHFVHYGCQELYEEENPGDWHSKGMLAVAIMLDGVFKGGIEF